jgi:hypothetical protein
MVLREIMDANSPVAGSSNCAGRWIWQKISVSCRFDKINVCMEGRLEKCIVYVFNFGCYEWFVSARNGAFSEERTEAKYITSDWKILLKKIFWRKKDEVDGQFKILHDEGLLDWYPIEAT